MKRTHLFHGDIPQTHGRRARAYGVCGQTTTKAKTTTDTQRVTCKDCIKRAGIVKKCSYKVCSNAATGQRVVLVEGVRKLLLTCDEHAAYLDAKIKQRNETTGAGNAQ
jgi:hypothetical protein